MQINQGHVVSFHYTLTDDSGDVIDTSDGGEPLAYLHGYAGIIPGLEREMEGKTVGDAFDAVIAPEDAYGLVDPDLIQEVPLDALAGIEGLSVGMQLQSQSPDGRVQQLVVDALGETTATLNANHALAGKTLTFAVSVESIRDATEEELSHGHVH